jgi:hypothetical protein
LRRETCNWRDAALMQRTASRCDRLATKKMRDSLLPYCEKHYRMVMELREWLKVFMRQRG